jgi:hypothetical protein
MSSILSTNYNVAFVEETHQQYVSYKSLQVGQIATREISDLWIISFSPTKQRVRMTFLQAKYHRATLNHFHRTFKGDYFQYELLSQRPMLTAVVEQRYNFPLDILSHSCCDSIGSYGIFFIDNSNHIDLAYCSANYLTVTNALPRKYASYLAHLNIPYNNTPQISLCACNQCSELISCFDIDTFTNSILQLEIGAELIHFPSILTFIRSVLQRQTTNTTLSQLIDFIDSQQYQVLNDDNANFDGLPSNLLIINTDEKKSPNMNL